jgi:hypothetical protein
LDWEKVWDPKRRPEFLEWLVKQKVTDDERIGARTLDALIAAVDKNPDEVFGRIKAVLSQTVLHQARPDWRGPMEWIVYEAPIHVDASLGTPHAAAQARVRAANDLGRRIEAQMVESLGSRRRYPAFAVDFWRMDGVLRALSTALTREGYKSSRIADSAIAEKDDLLAAFGSDLTSKGLLELDAAELSRALKVRDMDARRLKLELIKALGSKATVKANAPLRQRDIER